MTHDAFITKYKGRYLDFDGKFSAQCMDLMRCYLKEVLNFPPYSLPAVSYAYQVYTNFNPANPNFVKIPNTPTGVPQKGDLIFWKPYVLGVTGRAGHVAIFDSGNVNTMICFGQNWPTNSPCHLQKHSYKGVYGWLHRK